MTIDKSGYFLSKISNDIPNGMQVIIEEKLNVLPDEAFPRLMGIQLKSKLVVLLLSIFTGSVSIDRFYIGDISYGICKLLFGWLTLGIWPLLDIYFCYKRTLHLNYEKVLTEISYLEKLFQPTFD